MTTRKAFLDRTAADLMSREVLCLPRQMSLQAAARELRRAEVGGAPVVDECGHCIGVLSTTDLVRWMSELDPAPYDAGTRPTCFCSDWQVVDLESLPARSVEETMSTDVVTARPDTRVGELARWMIDDHIHRVIVTDHEGRPVGVVSTSDILAAVAQEDLLHAYRDS